MHREFLLNKIANYQPWPEEGSVKEELREFVEEFPRCFERGFEVGHITGSAWLIDPTGEKVLLTHHKKLNMWMQLGGHSDGDPDTKNVALKEAVEESGIDDIEFVSEDIFDMDIHAIPANPKEKAHYHFDVRFLLKAKTDQYIISDESNDLKWFTYDELEKLDLDTSVKRMMRKWKKL